MSTIVARGSDWVPLSDVGQRRLGEARLQAHHAIQWLARVARAYVPPQPDDSHTSMDWDGDVGGFTTHPFKDRAWLSLNIIDLTLVLRGGEGNAHVQPFSLDGRTNAQVHQWLCEQLDTLGLDAHALDMPLPYEMPVHAVSQGAPYDLAGLTDVLAQLAAWFNNAGLSLGSIQRQMIERGRAASPVRCWPHHFDLGISIMLPARNADKTGYVGAGLSPGDQYYDEPYFYVSIYPEPDPRVLPTLPMLGHWHERDFMAAIATAHRIVAAKNQQAETNHFLQAAIDGAIRVFS